MLRGKCYHHVSLFETKDKYQQVIKLLDRETIDAISVSTHDYSDKAFGTRQNMTQLTRAVTKLLLLRFFIER